MLEFPCFLFSDGYTNGKEVNDVRFVQWARQRGLFAIPIYVFFSGMPHAAFAIYKLNLGIIGTSVSVFGCGIGLFLASYGVNRLLCLYQNSLQEKVEEVFAAKWGWSKYLGNGNKVYKVSNREKPLFLQQLREKGIYFPSLSLGYKEQACTPQIFAREQMHRHVSFLSYGILGLTSFYFSPAPVALAYSMYLVVLCIFQQVGLSKIYSRSPRLYRVINVALQGVALATAMLAPETLLFSGWVTRYFFVFLIATRVFDGLWTSFAGEPNTKPFQEEELVKTSVSEIVRLNVQDSVSGVVQLGKIEPPAERECSENQDRGVVQTGAGDIANGQKDNTALHITFGNHSSPREEAFKSMPFQNLIVERGEIAIGTIDGMLAVLIKPKIKGRCLATLTLSLSDIAIKKCYEIFLNVFQVEYDRDKNRYKLYNPATGYSMNFRGEDVSKSIEASEKLKEIF